MELTLPPELEQRIQRQLESGRFSDAVELVSTAMDAIESFPLPQGMQRRPTSSGCWKKGARRRIAEMRFPADEAKQQVARVGAGCRGVKLFRSSASSTPGRLHAANSKRGADGCMIGIARALAYLKRQCTNSRIGQRRCSFQHYLTPTGPAPDGGPSEEVSDCSASWSRVSFQELGCGPAQMVRALLGAPQRFPHFFARPKSRRITNERLNVVVEHYLRPEFAWLLGRTA